MRKRAQRKSISVESSAKTIEPTSMKKSMIPKTNKQVLIAISLVAIFLMVLFLNTYFNVASGQTYNPDGDGLDRYYLSGPDPYYNMRIVEQTMFGENPGQYQFYSDEDPLLNYPLEHSGGRKPLMNMMAIFISQFASPFMDEVDALGLAMQFLPALFGALLVFPVYFIGKELFNRKTGLLAAFLIVLIPVHLGSGHGSAFALFDHDSFNLFMIIVTYLFLMKSLREKDTIKSMIFAALGGISLAGLQMVWVEAEFLFAIIALYAIVQMIVDMVTNKVNIGVPRTLVILMFTGYLLSLPVVIGRTSAINLELFLCLGVAVFGALYYFFDKKNIPWTLSLPVVFIIGVGGLIFLYFVPMIAESIPFVGSLGRISEILYGSGIYGNKVSDTIAEAGTYGMSRTVMSFGPALFWMSWIGFFLIGMDYVRNEHRRDHLLILLLFLVQIWFIFIAGRFINDLVVPVALLGAWMIWFMIDKIDYRSMIRSINAAGGGIHGLRRGVKFLHVFGVVFIAFLILLPNAYLSLDAAVPSGEKTEVFGDLPSGAFGGGIGKETYWVHAYEWLAQQDTEIPNPKDRPAYISWWDYGFYGSAVSDHPMVADNFQDGIPPAANFHTSTSEKEAISVWIVRLLEGNLKEYGSIQSSIINMFDTYIDENDTKDIIKWVEDPTSAPSYGTSVAEPTGEDVETVYPIGQQYEENAAYHDIADLLASYQEETITMIYRDLQEETGYSIRYYGVETYDKQIFNIFAYLADKSLLLVSGLGDYSPEDEFVEIKYVTQTDQELTYKEVLERSELQNSQDPIVDTRTFFKDAYFESMFYRTFIGVNQTDQDGSKSEPNYQLPCIDMKHFFAQYISPYPEYAVEQGKSAVVIAKYYECAEINGTIRFSGENRDLQIVVQQNVTHYGTQVPIDHDKETAFNGSYTVLVPAGVVSLQVRRYPELGANAFVVQNVTFNASDSSSVLAPITDEEATRKGVYQRTVDINVSSGKIMGTMYDDLDGNKEYNLTFDDPISNVDVQIFGIDTFDPSTGQPESYDFSMTQTLKTDQDGYYNTTEILPGYYQIVVTNKDGYQIENTIIGVTKGENIHNVVQPKPGDVEGTIFFDENANDIYDAGEEVGNVNVALIYTTTGQNTAVHSLITTADGSYKFDDLIPGSYALQMEKLPDYQSIADVAITENQTTQFNASIQFAPVTVSGVTKNKDTLDEVANVTIRFAPDPNVENNTAIEMSVTSDEKSIYTLDLQPGTYDVGVSHRITENNVNVTYSFEDTLVISIGQGSRTYEVSLSREEE